LSQAQGREDQRQGKEKKEALMERFSVQHGFLPEVWFEQVLDYLDRLSHCTGIEKKVNRQTGV
jgi:hypothetical protein